VRDARAICGDSISLALRRRTLKVAAKLSFAAAATSSSHTFMRPRRPVERHEFFEPTKPTGMTILSCRASNALRNAATRSCSREPKTLRRWSRGLLFAATIAAARATGARQKESTGASHLHLDRKAKRLAVFGKPNKVIDLDPFGALRSSIRSPRGSPMPHYSGTATASVTPMYRAGSPSSPINLRLRTRISFGSGSMTCGIFMRLNGYDRVARSAYCSTALGTTASRRLRSI
jgi:hypothetical protein